MADLRGARRAARWVGVIARGAPWVVAAWVLLAGGSLLLAISHLGVVADPNAMISAELPARRHHQRLLGEFPALRDELVLVVDAPTQEAADAAARTLERELGRHTRFELAVAPALDPYVEAQGLRLGSAEDFDAVEARLHALQPVLHALSREPTLGGVLRSAARASAASAAPAPAASSAPPTPPRPSPLERLLDALGAAAEAARAGETAPVPWRALLEGAGDGPVRQVVVALPVLEPGGLFPAGPALEAIREVAQREGWNRAGAPSLRITGGLAMSHEELETVLGGMAWIGLAVMVLVGGVLGWALRSVRYVLATVTTLVLGLLVTLGFATVAVGHLNLISVAFGVLYLGLAVDHAIHMGLRFREAYGERRDAREALARAIARTSAPVALCAATTALGFLAFVPTAYAGVAELGLVAGAGMAISLAAALTLLPALLLLAPGRPPAPRPPPRPPSGAGRRASSPLALAGAAALTLASLALLPQVAFNPNPLDLRDGASESVAAFRDLLATSKTPPWPLEALAADAEAADRLAADLRARPAVGRVVHLASFVPSDHPERAARLERVLGESVGAGDGPGHPAGAPSTPIERLHGVQDARVRLARTAQAGQRGAALRLDAALVSILLLDPPERDGALGRLEHAILAGLPELRAPLGPGDARAPEEDARPPERIRAQWVGATGVHRVEAFPREPLDGVPAMRRFVDEVRAVAPDASGAPVLILASGDAVVGAFRQALLTAVVVGFLIVLLALRSFADALRVVVPLLLATAWTGATMVLLGDAFDFANVIALPLLFGIGLDGGIHLVARAREGDRAGTALRHTTTARGILFAALTTLVSFGNLALSPHPGTAGLGRLLAIGVLWSLVGTLGVLPHLLRTPRERLVEGARGRSSS